jgi:hypothetical protein
LIRNDLYPKQTPKNQLFRNHLNILTDKSEEDNPITQKPLNKMNLRDHECKTKFYYKKINQIIFHD